MRVAAIDIGTNSVHLLVAEVSPEGEVSIIEKARQQVELGAGGLSDNRLTEAAQRRGLSTLAMFGEACSSLGVHDIVATATSAVREAENGSDFCRAVRKQTGIHVRIIPGEEEARLIWMGAGQDVDYSQGPALLMDLGGGSVEFVHCDRDKLHKARSLPLGHIRMTERFGQAADRQLGDLRAYVRRKLKRLAKAVPPSSVQTLVGTSGAIRTLGRMATLAGGARAPEHDHGLVLRRDVLAGLTMTLTSLKPEHYAKLPGMDPRRKRTLPAAAVVVSEVMDLYGMKELLTSERSLRDGIIQDWIVNRLPELSVSEQGRGPRMRSVRATMRRYDVESGHATRVRDMAHVIFDASAPVHGLDPEDRKMLEYACLLHDVGHHISGAGHNKHGAYLIRHTRLYGFTAPEIDVLASLVRYHRGGRPKQSHAEFAALSAADRRRVTLLAGILRFADGMDRGHTGAVDELSAELRDDALHVRASAPGEAHVEKWAVSRRRSLLQDALGCHVNVEFVRRPSED